MAIDPNKVVHYDVFQKKLAQRLQDPTVSKAEAVQEAERARQAAEMKKVPKTNCTTLVNQVTGVRKVTDSSKTKKTKSPFFLSFEPEETLEEDLELELEEIKNNYPEKKEQKKKQENNKRENNREESQVERKAREKCEKAKANLIGAVTAYQKLPINLNNPTWYENLKERFEYHLEVYKSAYLHYAQIANNSPQDVLQSEILQIN